MSRRRQKPPRRIQIPIQELNAIVERTRSEALPEAEHATLKAAVETLARLTAELESTQTTLARVQRILFGSPTESTAAVLGEAKTAASPPADAPTSPAATPGETNPGTAASAAADADTQPQREKKKRPGHGRNGADDYPERLAHRGGPSPLAARRSLSRVGL
jgi:transposase